MTPSEINRRLAEFAGWTRIQWNETHERLFGDTPDGRICEYLPDYWTSADAVLPLVERVCRERGLSLAIELGQLGPAFETDKFVVVIGQYHPGGLEWHASHQSVPAAICLALVAVLDGVEAGGE